MDPVPRAKVAQTLAGMRILITGDSQMRNTWVNLARVLGVKFPGDDKAHDGHNLDLSDVRETLAGASTGSVTPPPPRGL